MSGERPAPLDHLIRWLGMVLVSWAIVCSMWTLASYASLGERLQAATALLAALGIIAVLLVTRKAPGVQTRLHAALSAPTRKQWLWGVLLTGVVLRFGYWLIVQPRWVSDHQVYWNLAISLVTTGQYGQDPADMTYWPPGMPLWLVPWIAMFGSAQWVVVLAALVLFVVLTLALYRFAESMAGEVTARAATLVVALWPNLIASSSLVSKELLAAALIAVSMLCFQRAVTATSSTRTAGLTLASGLVMGFVALAQPGLAVLPLAWMIAFLIQRPSMVRVGLVSLCIAAGFAASIVPWSVRNYAHFGVVVPISTNGGYNFYRANNELATGGFTERGQVDLESLSELERNAEGFRLGKLWIQEHPGDFARLAIRKQVLVLGDDSDGFFWSIRRGTDAPDWLYAATKLMSNGFWLLVLALMLRAFLLQPKGYLELGPLMIVGSLAYLVCMYSVFESGSRHHVPLTAMIAILAAQGLVAASGRVRASAPVTEPLAAAPLRASH